MLLQQSILLGMKEMTSINAVANDILDACQFLSFLKNNPETFDLSVKDWMPTSEASLYKAAYKWHSNIAASCTQPMDFLCYSAWGDLLDGIKDRTFYNCFLGGVGGQSFIDSDMVQFADMRWISKKNDRFITWLGFARQVRVDISGSCILHAFGPLFRLPQEDMDCSIPLGSIWSIGYWSSSNSIPQPCHYAMKYICRVSEMKTALREDCHVPPALLQSLNFRNGIKGVDREMDGSRYRMRIGTETFSINMNRGVKTLNILRFNDKGLVEQRMEMKFTKKQSFSLSTKCSAKLSVDKEQEFEMQEVVNSWRTPVPVLEKFFRSPSMKEYLQPEYGLNARQMAEAHVLAALNCDYVPSVSYLNGEGLCSLRHTPNSDRIVLFMNGPFTMSVLCASGWDVKHNGIFDWRSERVSIVNQSVSFPDGPATNDNSIRSDTACMCSSHRTPSYINWCNELRQLENEGLQEEHEIRMRGKIGSVPLHAKNLVALE